MSEAPSAPAYAEGENFSFQLSAGDLVCRIWKRPDLSAAEGAELAHRMATVCARAGRDPQVAAVVFDLRDAPPVFGPRTEVAFQKMLASLRPAQPVVMLVGPNATQRLQHVRIASGFPHVQVREGSLEEALASVAARRGASPAPKP